MLVLTLAHIRWRGGCWRSCFLRGWRLRGLFLVFLDQAAHRVGWLGAFTDPVFSPVQFQRAVVAWFFRIVRADDLDKLPVARAAAIRHHHFVIGAIFRAFSS